MLINIYKSIVYPDQYVLKKKIVFQFSFNSTLRVQPEPTETTCNVLLFTLVLLFLVSSYVYDILNSSFPTQPHTLSFCFKFLLLLFLVIILILQFLSFILFFSPPTLTLHRYLYPQLAKEELI